MYFLEVMSIVTPHHNNPSPLPPTPLHALHHHYHGIEEGEYSCTVAV